METTLFSARSLLTMIHGIVLSGGALIGVAIALFTLRRAIRQKGFRGGVADSALDATPFVGAAKNMYEVMRGDIIPDRVPARATGTRR